MESEAEKLDSTQRGETASSEAATKLRTRAWRCPRLLREGGRVEGSQLGVSARRRTLMRQLEAAGKGWQIKAVLA